MPRFGRKREKRSVITPPDRPHDAEQLEVAAGDYLATPARRVLSDARTMVLFAAKHLPRARSFEAGRFRRGISCSRLSSTSS
jgi:hypothetical protein